MSQYIEKGLLFLHAWPSVVSPYNSDSNPYSGEVDFDPLSLLRSGDTEAVSGDFSWCHPQTKELVVWEE